MSEKVTFSKIWHTAGIAGIVLASISIAYMLAGYWLGTEPSAWKVIVSGILWAGKLFLCVWLMYMFMARFRIENQEATRSDVRHLGMLIAALSALIFATVEMAFYDNHMELITDSLEKATKTYGKMMDANSRAALKDIEGNITKYIFFGQFVYCYIFGWILSAILATKIVKDNPFAE